MDGLTVAQMVMVSANIVGISLLIFLGVITTTISLYMIGYELHRKGGNQPRRGEEWLNQPSTQDA